MLIWSFSGFTNEMEKIFRLVFAIILSGWPFWEVLQQEVSPLSYQSHNKIGQNKQFILTILVQDFRSSYAAECRPYPLVIFDRVPQEPFSEMQAVVTIEKHQ